LAPERLVKNVGGPLGDYKTAGDQGGFNAQNAEFGTTGPAKVRDGDLYVEVDRFRVTDQRRRQLLDEKTAACGIVFE
jgi:hypothetical protein